jgi:hypothetical protein
MLLPNSGRPELGARGSALPLLLWRDPISSHHALIHGIEMVSPVVSPIDCSWSLLNETL